MAKSCVTNHLLVLHIPANGFYEDLIHNFPRGNGETGLTPEPQALLLALCEDESIFYPFSVIVKSLLLSPELFKDREHLHNDIYSSSAEMKFLLFHYL